MTPNKLQEIVLRHFYVLVGPQVNILKIDIIWTTKKGSNQNFKNMAAD